ncbi:MAG: MBL fold metallo-hydrolase, partial [Phycisphaerales bacterium]|nr:MBL fold metallo-hydrolase [Phycisphaerales bacterium]
MFMRMIYDEKLAQAAYLIGCQRTGEAIVIDPERDVDRYIDLARENGLRLTAVAETHIHADFVSGARELAERTGARVHVSDEGGDEWSSTWLDESSKGTPYDHRRLRHGDTFSVGNIDFKALHTPGHTPEHLSFLVTDRGGGADAPIGMATGDFIFVGDLGRPDLLESAAGQAGQMEPSARRLFRTLATLGDIPDFVQVWPAHGAGSACGKALGAVPSSTLGYERRFNAAIRAATDESSFVEFILAGQPEPPLYFANMKHVNRVGPRVLGDLPRPAALSVEDLRRLDPKRVVLIDTRPWEAFRTCHVPGSLSIPLTRSFNTDAGSFIGPDDEIHLILAPEDLDEAIRDLVRIGLDHIEGWFDASRLEAYDDATHSLTDVPEVEVADAARMIDDGDVKVLDVRRATEFAEGHLPGATNIAHTRLASRLDEVPGHARLLVNCRSGYRSARAS